VIGTGSGSVQREREKEEINQGEGEGGDQSGRGTQREGDGKDGRQEKQEGRQERHLPIPLKHHPEGVLKEGEDQKSAGQEGLERKGDKRQKEGMNQRLAKGLEGFTTISGFTRFPTRTRMPSKSSWNFFIFSFLDSPFLLPSLSLFPSPLSLGSLWMKE